MTANATHPGRITIPGTDLGVRGTLVAEPQTENMVLALDDRLALGPVKVDTDATGTLEAPGLVVPIVSGVLWLLRFEPHRHELSPFALGVYNLNTSGVALDDLVPTVATTITETDRLNIAAALALGATNDTATASFVSNPASATRTAANAVYAAKPSNGAQAVGKGEIVFRVTDYGAVPDGVTSCTTAFNAAGLAASNAGVSGAAFGRAVVEFPYTPDGYSISTLTTLYSGVTYRGDRHVLFKRTNVVGGNSLFNATPTTDVTIEGFTLHGNSNITAGIVMCGTRTTIRDCIFTEGVAWPAVYPVNFAGGATLQTDVLVTGCRFIGGRNGVHITGNTARVTVEDCDFVGWSSTAIAVDGNATTRSTDVMIRNNRVHDFDARARMVTTKQIAGNVATLTLASAHPWVVGETVWVDIGDTAYDGSNLLTAVTSTTLSWAKTAANSGPTASAGLVASGNRQPISVQGDSSENSYHERVTITGNQVLGNYTAHNPTSGTTAGYADCISVAHTKGTTIGNNLVEGSGDGGIAVSYRTWRATITNNVLVGSNGAGIWVGAQGAGAYVKMLSITGNTVVNSGQFLPSGSWASTGINLRQCTGAIIEGNMLGDDQTVPTQSYGISLGDTTGTNVDVHLGPNHFVGNTTAKRFTLPGNVRTTVIDIPTTVSVASDVALALNSTALVNVTALVAPLEVNAVYEIEGVIGYTTNGVGTGTPGIKIGFAPLATASHVLVADSNGSSGTGAATVTSNSNRAYQTTLASLINAGGVTGATPARITFKARVTTGTTAGNYQITAAQQTADAVNTTTIVAGSYLKYQRVS